TTQLDETKSAWLMNELKQKKALKIVASHDRDFLDKISDEIWSIEDTKIAVYPGNYSHYKEIEAHNKQRAKLEYDKYIREKQHLEKAVENKSRQAALSNRPKNKTDSDFRQKGAKPYFNKLQKKLRSEEHTSELQSRFDLVCRLLLEKKKKKYIRQKSHT